MKYALRRGLVLGLVALPLAQGAASATGLATQSAGGDRELRMVMAQEPETSDPCQSAKSSIGRVYSGNVAEALVDVDPVSAEVVPVLATAWEEVEPTKWRFTLREGVTFHNGEAFTADAVKVWMDRAMQEAAPCYVRGHVIEPDSGVVSTEAVDPLTVEFTLGQPDPIFPRRMSGVDIGWLPEGFEASEQVTDPIGTGAYRFVSHDVGSSLRLERNPDYWGEQPQVEGVEYVFREESSVRAAMANAGEVDIAAEIGPQDADSPGAITYTLAETLYFRFDARTPPLDDLRVRQAINLGIDRQLFIDVVFGGNGEPANELFISSVEGSSPNVVWEYDPDRARELIEEARADGVPVDEQIEIISILGERGSNGSEVQDTIAAMLNEMGLNAIGVGVEIDERIRRCCEEPYSPDYAPALLGSWHGNSIGDAAHTYIQKMACESDEAVLCDETLDQMIHDAAVSSGEERVANFQAAAEYMFENVVPNAPIMHGTDTIIIANESVQYEPNPGTFEGLALADVTFAQ